MEAADGAAVVLVDDHVLGHVHETARQVTGVGRLEGRVRQTLPGTVRGDEVLEDGQALLEVGQDRVLNDVLTPGCAGLLRLGHQAPHAAQLADLLLGTTGSGVHHHVDGVEALLVGLQALHQDVGQPRVGVRPDVDDLVVPLVVGDEAHVVVVHHLADALVGTVDQLDLLLRNDDVIQVEAQATLVRHREAELLDVVEELDRAWHAHRQQDVGDDAPQALLGEELVDETGLVRHDLVEQDPSHRRVDDGRVARVVFPADLDAGVQRGAALVVGDDDLLRGVERHALTLDRLLLGGLALLGDVVQAEDHVLGRNRDRRSVGRVEDVVAGQHEQLGLQDGGRAERQVHSHLVPVEVSVERRTGKRVQLEGLALDHLRLEGLDAEAVQGRSPVEQHGVRLHHVLEDVPHHGLLGVHNLLGGLHRLDHTPLDHLADDERLVELGGHVLRHAALVELELRSHDDDGTGGVVHTLTEQVLTETALLALEAVGQGLQRAVALRLHGGGLPAVVEQAVHGLLQHPLLVPEDHVRGLDLDQALQTVVPDDDTAVQVIEVGRGETATVERHQRAQLRRNHRDDLDDHPLRLVLHAVVGIPKGLHHLQTLEGLVLPLLAGLRVGRVAQVEAQRVEVEVGQHVVQGLRAHLGDELVGVLLVQVLVVLGQGVEDVEVLLLREELVHLQCLAVGLGRHARLDHHVTLVVDDLVELLGRQAEQVANLVGQAPEVPDVRHGNHELDVAHALAADLLLGHLHAAAVTHDALVADALVLAAVALVVLDGAEDALAEEAIALRLVRPVVDGLRLQHLAVALLEDFLGRRHADADLVEVAGELRGLVVGHLLVINELEAGATQASRATVNPNPRNSCMRTLKDSGMPGVGIGSPFTMAS